MGARLRQLEGVGECLAFLECSSIYISPQLSSSCSCWALDCASWQESVTHTHHCWYSNLTLLTQKQANVFLAPELSLQRGFGQRKTHFCRNSALLNTALFFVIPLETRKLRNSFPAIGSDTRFCLQKEADNFEHPVNSLQLPGNSLHKEVLNSRSNIDCGSPISVVSQQQQQQQQLAKISHYCCLLRLTDLRMISRKGGGGCGKIRSVCMGWALSLSLSLS